MTFDEKRFAVKLTVTLETTFISAVGLYDIVEINENHHNSGSVPVCHYTFIVYDNKQSTYEVVLAHLSLKGPLHRPSVSSLDTPCPELSALSVPSVSF